MYQEVPRIIKIGLAEDHDLVRAGITKLINAMHQFSVVLSEKSGSSLIACLTSKSDKPDICLVDFRMKGMDGIATCQAIQNQWPQIKCMILTIYDQLVYRKLAACASVASFLPKTISRDELRFALLEVYTKGYYYTEAYNEWFVKKTPYEMSGLLSTKELAFLTAYAQHMSHKEIAMALEIPMDMVERLRKKVKTKLNLETKQELIYAAKEMKLIF